MRPPARTAAFYRELARASRLHYVAPGTAGITRRRAGKSFRYRAPAGVDLAVHVPRIRSLAIPPAWTDVWICADPRGHLQSTGRDVRGRLQYRYHPDWIAACAQVKYRRILLAGRRLPRVRRKVRRDLRRRGLPQEKVLAAVVRLLERSLVRVGNDEYARNNRSFGLTTLRDRHVRVTKRGHIELRFRGKGNISHQVRVRAPRIARVIRTCRNRPGRDLFKFEDEQGVVRDITAQHVNAYLQEAAGLDMSAKDFRTWAATVLMHAALLRSAPALTARERARNARAAIAEVAARLNNTTAVCRGSYVHPRVAECYLAGDLRLRRYPPPEFGRIDLSALERATLTLLEAASRTPAAPPVQARKGGRRGGVPAS